MRKILLFALAFPWPVFANFDFVPNHQRARREISRYSSIVWTERRELNVILNEQKTSERLAGDLRNHDAVRAAMLKLFWRVDSNWNVEAEVDRTWGTDQNYFAAEYDNVSGANVGLAFGHAFQDRPYGLSGQFLHATSNRQDETTGERRTTTVQAPSLAAGWKMGQGLYSGAGMRQVTVVLPDDDNSVRHQGAVGLGKVWGEDRDPQAAGEVVLEYTNFKSSQSLEARAHGLYNFEPFQFFGNFGFTHEYGSRNGRSIEVDLGLDWQWGRVFLGPMLNYQNDDVSSTQRTRTTSTDLALQLGLRERQYEVYAEISSGDQKDKISTSADDTRQLTQLWEVAGRFSF